MLSSITGRSKRSFAIVASSFLLLPALFLFFNSHSSSKLPRIASQAPKPSPPLYRKIWQSSKLSPMALEEQYRTNVKRWNDVNPTWRYELLTDQGCDAYVLRRFEDDLDITETFLGLQDNILRADLIRYLVLLGDGGVYSDMDTECLKAIDDWVPEKYKETANVVIGIEYDTLGQGRGQALLDMQLANWTLMSKAGHGLMRLVVKNAIKAIAELGRKQGQSLMGIKATFNDVLKSTGPASLTMSTWEYLSEVTGTQFTWKNVTGITTPLLVHDVLILPVTSFGNGQAHSYAKPATDKDALVHHQFSGTWKKGSHAYKNMNDAEKAEKPDEAVQ